MVGEARGSALSLEAIGSSGAPGRVLGLRPPGAAGRDPGLGLVRQPLRLCGLPGGCSRPLGWRPLSVCPLSLDQVRSEGNFFRGAPLSFRVPGPLQSHSQPQSSRPGFLSFSAPLRRRGRRRIPRHVLGSTWRSRPAHVRAANGNPHFRSRHYVPVRPPRWTRAASRLSLWSTTGPCRGCPVGADSPKTGEGERT